MPESKSKDQETAYWWQVFVSVLGGNWYELGGMRGMRCADAEILFKAAASGARWAARCADAAVAEAIERGRL